MASLKSSLSFSAVVCVTSANCCICATIAANVSSALAAITSTISLMADSIAPNFSSSKF